MSEIKSKTSTKVIQSVKTAAGDSSNKVSSLIGKEKVSPTKIPEK